MGVETDRIQPPTTPIFADTATKRPVNNPRNADADNVRLVSNRTIATRISNAFDAVERKIALVFCLYSALLIVVAIVSPIVGDYCAYIQQWDHVYRGFDPWAAYSPRSQIVPIHWFNFCSHYVVRAPNAYGPLFNLYGLMAVLHPVLPRVVGTILYLMIAWQIFSSIHHRADLTRVARFILYLSVFANVLTWALVGVIGGNDIYVAFFICVAILAIRRNNPALAGAALGLGALIKFYPLYLVPFLALDRRRFDVRLVLGAGTVFMIGMSIAYLHWGNLIFEPLTTDVQRDATPSSVIFLLAAGLRYAVHVSIPSSRLVLMCLAPLALTALILQYALRISNLAGFIVAYILILTFNQNGYAQYYFPLMLAIYFYYLFDHPADQASRALAVLFASILCQAILLVLAKDYRPDLVLLRMGASPIILIVNLSVAVVLLRRHQEVRQDVIDENDADHAKSTFVIF